MSRLRTGNRRRLRAEAKMVKRRSALCRSRKRRREWGAVLRRMNMAFRTAADQARIAAESMRNVGKSLHMQVGLSFDKQSKEMAYAMAYGMSFDKFNQNKEKADG